MKLNYHLLSSLFLSVILLTGAMVPGFLISDVFAANEKQNVGDNDKKPLKPITQSNIESLKGLNANEKRVFVFYKNDVTSEDLTELTEKGANVKYDFEKMRAVVVQIDAAKLKDLQLDPNIERIVEDRIVHATLDTSIPQIGANSVYSSGITGQGVKTCIVDTGVDDTHPALNPLISQYDFVNGDNDATDDHGHGTHVAGIIASRDSIYKGVAPDSSLMAAKVLNSVGSGFESNVIAGINWCVANGADVINLSLGGGLFPGTCDFNGDADAVNDAVAAGVIVAVASGNDGTINALSSPACASGAIAVGAIDDSDGRTPFSNEGIELDVVAPGAPVTSLKAPINGGGFATFQGTSMATPHVAGLAALLLDANPTLTQTQVRSAIENNALDLGVAGFDTLYGNGRIQASNSVNSVLPLSDSISSATGTGTISFSTVFGGISSLNSISESTLPTSGKPATSFPHGFTSWTVAGLTSGQTITVTLTYPSAIPAGSQYWKVIGGSWVDATSILGSNDGDNTLTLTIQDNGPFDVNSASGIISDPGGPGVNPPTISISDATPISEGNSGNELVPLDITLSSASSSTVTVVFATSDGTATDADNDYTPGSGPVTFLPGETTKQVIVIVTGDTTVEPDETYDIVLSDPTNATILDGTGVVTMLNDDIVQTLPTISISDATPISEGNSGNELVPLDITLSSASSSTVTVVFATSDGTATDADNDYTPGSGPVTFLPGETTKQVIVIVTGDTTVEPDETYDIVLSDPTNATILDGTGVVTMLNDDIVQTLPTISISDATPISEGNSGNELVPLDITLSSASSSTVTVVFATSDGTATDADNDYTPGSGPVTFLPGETTKQVIVIVTGDTTVEPDETYDIVLSDPTNATILDGTGVVTMLNDDIVQTLPTISISDATPISEGNSGNELVPLDITLSSASSSTVTVVFATSDGTATDADNDYTPGSGPVTFLPGETTKQVIVIVTGDTTVEPDETYDIVLSDPTNATILDGTGVVTMLNDDPPTISINNIGVTEGDTGTTPAPFTVSLSGPSTSTVTVDFFTFDVTATGFNIDYATAAGTLTFSPGNTTQTVPIEVIGDITVESNETFNVALSNPVNTSILDDTGVGTILDDDGIIIPPRAFLSINSGGSGTILSVFGSGFTSGSDVTVQFDGTTLSITPATNGKFTTPITIPTSISGTHTISASDEVNTFTNQFIVIAPRVTPTGTVLFLNPINSASPDSVVLLHGKGFAGNADATITISVDGVPITTTTVGKVGSFKNISITMPSTLGTHTVSASDGINTAFSTFYIIP